MRTYTAQSRMATRGVPDRAGAEATDAPAVPEMFRVRPRAIWRFLRTQPASFWLINFYLFIEYVRPQQIYTFIDFLPWGLLAIVLTVLAMFVEGKIPRFRTLASGTLIVFTIVLILSSIMAVNPSQSYKGWQLYFSWVLVYLMITNIITSEKRFFVFMLAFMLYCFKMSQHGVQTWVLNGFGFSSWGATGGPGWFHNSGEFGIQMCIFLPLSVEFALAMRKHLGKFARIFFFALPFTAVASMVASSSRGALVGGGAVALWWVARSKHRVRALIAVAVLGALTWAVVPPEQKLRFSTAGDDNTSTSRIDRWKAGIKMANENPVFGIGYDNWITSYGPLSHNIFIQAWSELGYTGLFAFVGMIGATFVVNARTRRVLARVPTSTPFMKHMAYGLDGALIGYLTSGFFVTVLYYPYFWVNLAMTVALHTAALNARREAAARTHHSAAARWSRAIAPQFP